MGIDLGFWNNVSMFLGNDEGQLVLYDPTTQGMTSLQIGVPESPQLITYMESLISVKRE